MKKKKGRLKIILEKLSIGETHREPLDGDPRTESVFEKKSDFRFRHWFQRRLEDVTIQIYISSDIWTD
jgi:hypothetical protein